MSRTDKTDPWWVRATQWAPRHGHCERFHENEFAYFVFFGAEKEPRECNLPAEPDIKRDGRQNWRTKDRQCRWLPVWPRRDRYMYTWPPSREDRRAGYWGPDRARVRDQLKSAAKEFRAAGEVDTIASTVNHRHYPMTGGWWS